LKKEELYNLFQEATGEQALSIAQLPAAGSHRTYYRMTGASTRLIGAFSPDPLETKAFIGFTRHFRDAGLNVPELVAENTAEGIYLIQDLGDLTLKEEVDRTRREENPDARILPLYKQALDHLIRFQVEGGRGLDYSLCVPRQEFDRQSIMWDLNHFKYYFIKLLGIPFDEQELENDFRSFTDLLSTARSDFFLYRDFQSRNIMILEDELYFIDYQGGRRGALQYDVASLLWESRVNLGNDMRKDLLDYHLKNLQDKAGIPSGEFNAHYYAFVLIRILQVLGTYGIRGIVENKALFLQSIPYAIRNLIWLRENSLIPGGYPELSSCLDRISAMSDWIQIPEQGELTVTINSFSYKKGLPRDLSGNGGGFVFDCRALPNPGREERFRDLTGQDREVIEYLGSSKEVDVFLEQAKSMVRQSAANYKSRGFSNLMVSFGCTGGQHRSVYSAERMNEFLQTELGINTRLNHRELKV
jgi:aminoglycoside/choline kinase family phosphotransferase